MNRLNLYQLRLFAAVVDCGGFSAAAVRVGLTQPAVSMQIRNLEQTLGVALLERVGRTVAPTAAGRDLLAFGRRIEAEADAAVLHLDGYAGGRRGRIRLGTGATACIYLLPPILAALRRDHPQWELTVVTGNAPEMIDALEANIIDLALVTLPVARRSLTVCHTFADTLVAALPPAAGPMPATLTPTDFAERPLILYERGGAIRAIIDDWLAAADPPLPPPVMELGNIEAIKKLVEAGLGASILSSVTVADETRDGRLLVRPLRPRLNRRLGLVKRRDKSLDAPLAAMIEAVQRLWPEI